MPPAALPARSATPIFSRFRKALPSRPPSNRSFVLAAVALVSLWAAACGDGATAPPPAPPNQAPVRVGAIPAQTLGVGETGTINVAEYFNDPDGDALTYTAASSNAATASVTVAGSVVTIAAAAKGVASITITARDGGGLSAQQTLTVAVPNRGPTPAGTIPAQTVFVGEAAPVEMSTYFIDPDGDMLTYSAASSNATVVSASVAGSVVSLARISHTSRLAVVGGRPDEPSRVAGPLWGEISGRHSRMRGGEAPGEGCARRWRIPAGRAGRPVPPPRGSGGSHGPGVAVSTRVIGRGRGRRRRRRDARSPWRL